MNRMIRWIVVAALVAVPGVSYALCEAVMGSQDVGSCAVIQACDPADTSTLCALYLNPKADGGLSETCIGCLESEEIHATLDIRERITDGGSTDIRLRSPETGFAITDGLQLQWVEFAGAYLTNNETSTSSPINFVNADGFLRLQADGDTEVSDDLEVTADVRITGFLTTPKFADLDYLADANGNELLKLDTVASAVNELTLSNAATTGAPILGATGGDTNISMTIRPKGTGSLLLDNNSDANGTSLKLYEVGTLGGAVAGHAAFGDSFLDLNIGNSVGHVRVSNSAGTATLMDCDDGQDDSCIFLTAVLSPRTTMPTCNAAAEGAMAYDGDGTAPAQGLCVCAETTASTYGWVAITAGTQVPDCA